LLVRIGGLCENAAVFVRIVILEFAEEMINSYGSVCDDFFVEMYVHTKLDLPVQRDTILSFFERIERQFPSMSSFNRLEGNGYRLDEGHTTGEYRWVGMETDRIVSGVVNPSDLEKAYDQHRFVLEIIPYLLSVSHLDIDCLDISFAMDFECTGNHDEIIAEALLADSGLGCLSDIPSSKAVNFSPSIVFSLDEGCLTQGRCSIESKTGIYESAKQKQGETEPITLSFTVRRYPSSKEVFEPSKSFEYQSQLIEELMTERIIPHLVRPLTSVIAQKRLLT